MQRKRKKFNKSMLRNNFTKVFTKIDFLKRKMILADRIIQENDPIDLFINIFYYKKTV